MFYALDSNLPVGFWAEAAATATYLINRSPSSRLLKSNMTPHEAWTGAKPSVTGLRPFGCPAYAHIPKEKRKKLEFRAKKCILLGYAPGAKAYRLWDPKAHSVIISRDVIFDERPTAIDPSKRVDLSEIIWSGVEIDDPQITRVGDAWEKDSDMEKLPKTLKESSQSPLQLGSEDETPLESQIPLEHVQSQMPVEGAHVPQQGISTEPNPSRRHRRTQLELLGTPPDTGGTRLRQLPHRHEQVPNPVPPPNPEVIQNPEVEDVDGALENVAFAFAASTGSPDDPVTWAEAMRRPDASEWETALEKELDSLDKTGTFEPVDSLPPGRKAIDSKLVFKIKRHANGTIECYKVRLVAKGFRQIPGLDFDETFAPVVKLTSIRILCALAVRLRLHFHHLDVETAFLNGKLDNELYLKLPHDCGKFSGQLKRLHKSMYGLKQASRVWNILLDEEVSKIG